MFTFLIETYISNNSFPVGLGFRNFTVPEDSGWNFMAKRQIRHVAENCLVKKSFISIAFAYNHTNLDNPEVP